MSNTDELLNNAKAYKESFTKGDLPPGSTPTACSASRRVTHTSSEMPVAS
jgi:hypothetical protein